MNKLIKELADKATSYKEGLINGKYDIEVFDKEKFAELIVRECAKICDQQGRVGWNDDRKVQARLDRDLIKEHFGVE